MSRGSIGLDDRLNDYVMQSHAPEHPVLANVLAFVIMLLGGVAVFVLPVSEYPPITPPTVQVTTT